MVTSIYAESRCLCLCFPLEFSVLGDVSVRGVSVLGRLCDRDLSLPPVNRMTHACENSTFPQTSFAGGNKLH